MTFQPKPLPRSVLTAVAASLVILRLVILIPSSRAHDAHVRSFRAAAAQVQRGTRVLVATASPTGCDSAQSWDLLDEHLPALLAIDRDAFVSTVFAGEGMQPILWKLNVRHTAKPNLLPPSFRDLEHTTSYAGWREHYDYLALRDCAAERASPPNLSLVARSDTYRLYKVVHASKPLAARS